MRLAHTKTGKYDKMPSDSDARLLDALVTPHISNYIGDDWALDPSLPLIVSSFPWKCSFCFVTINSFIHSWTASLPHVRAHQAGPIGQQREPGVGRIYTAVFNSEFNWASSAHSPQTPAVTPRPRGAPSGSAGRLGVTVTVRMWHDRLDIRCDSLVARDHSDSVSDSTRTDWMRSLKRCIR